jgi:hypothetical protein
MKKTHTSKPTGAPEKPAKLDAVSPKRIFGSAKGQITFKKGWDAPMTERELDEFLGE